MQILLFLVLLFTVLPLSARIGDISFYTLDLALIPFVGITLIRQLISRSEITAIWSKEELFLIGFIVLAGVSTALSINKTASIDAYALWLRFAAFYWALRTYFAENHIDPLMFLKFSYTALAILITVGAFQLITSTKAGVLTNYFGSGVDTNSSVFLNPRISGTSNNSNVYGAWLVTFTLCVVAWRQHRKQSNVITIAILGFTSILVLATLSKAGVLYLVSAMLLLFVTTRNTGNVVYVRVFLVIAALCVVIFVLSYTELGSGIIGRFIERITKEDSRSYTSRVEVLYIVPQLLSELRYLLIGTGPSVFFETVQELGIYHNTFASWVDAANKRAGIHNILLNFVTSFGIFATLFFVAGYSKIVLRSRAILKRKYNPNPVFAFVFLTTIIVPSMFNTVVWSVSFFPFVVYWAAIVSNRRRKKSSI